MKKMIAFFSALMVCLLLLVSCGTASTTDASKTHEPPTNSETTVEDLYDELVQYASEGKYVEGWRLANSKKDVLAYKDGQAYYDYCQAMQAYTAGGIGKAYGILKSLPDILDAKKTAEEISNRISQFDGYYIADKGNGILIHLVIREGQAAFGIIGANEPNQTFHYTDEDFKDTIVVSEYSDGTEFYAIGDHLSMSEDITIGYVMFTETDDPSIMLIAHESSEFTTFNGLYKPAEQ